jgi:hypothetical protein
VLAELVRSLVAQVVVRPVWLLVNVAVFVVELGIEQHQPRQLIGPPRRVVGHEAPAKARAQQADAGCSRDLADMGQGNADVVQVGAESVISSCRPLLSPWPRRS